MQKKQIVIFLGLIIICFLSSCVTSQRVNFLQEPSKKIPSYPVFEDLEDYLVDVGDELSVHIFSLEKEADIVFNSKVITGDGNVNIEKSLHTYTVTTDSCITFPYVGKINVVGKTTRDISYFIKSKLKNKYILSDFTVKVNLVNNAFFIVTESGSSRQNIVNEQMNIFQAIALSPDLSLYADRANIKIIRQTLEGTEIKEFDIRSKDLINSEYYYIRPNDVIYIQSFDGQFFKMDSLYSFYGLFSSSLFLGMFIFALIF